MKISRNKLIKKIYDRLAEIEVQKANGQTSDTQAANELKRLRINLQDVMNSRCPIYGDIYANEEQR